MYCFGTPRMYINPAEFSYVWIRYGQVIGTTPGNNYTVYLDAPSYAVMILRPKGRC